MSSRWRPFSADIRRGRNIETAAFSHSRLLSHYAARKRRPTEDDLSRVRRKDSSDVRVSRTMQENGTDLEITIRFAPRERIQLENRVAAFTQLHSRRGLTISHLVINFSILLYTRKRKLITIINNTPWIVVLLTPDLPK